MRTLISSLLSCLPLAAQASWTQLYPSQNPPLRSSVTWMSHEATGSLLMMYGTDVATGLAATQACRFQAGTWALQPGPLPPVRFVPAVGYDAVHQQTVMFGGWSPTTGLDLDETWLWNGNTWTQVIPPVRPSARSQASMAFDHTRGVLVLFGGRLFGSGDLADTWEWNGTTWQLRATASAPPARSNARMAFDPVSASVLLQGGMTAVGSQLLLFNDTWSFNGTQWVQRQPAVSPSPRTDACMVTDLRRQRIVLVGGQTFDPFAWEWDGATWSPRYQPCPVPRLQFGLGYDSLARRVIVAGGGVQVPSSTVYWQNDTWSFQTPLPADVAPFGSGCAGTAGTPALAAAPFALPWLGDTMRNIVQTIPAGEPGAVFVSSFGSTPPIPLGGVGMPGCDLLVPIDVVEFRLATNGRAQWELAIPNTPSLAAVSFRQQAFVLDAAANALGLTASNAVLITTGVR